MYTESLCQSLLHLISSSLASEKRTLSIFDSRKQAVINLKLAPRKQVSKEEKENPK